MAHMKSPASAGLSWALRPLALAATRQREASHADPEEGKGPGSGVKKYVTRRNVPSVCPPYKTPRGSVAHCP